MGAGGGLGYNPAFSNQIPNPPGVTAPLWLSRVRAEEPPTIAARAEDSKTQMPVYSSRKVVPGDAWEYQQGDGSAPERT